MASRCRRYRPRRLQALKDNPQLLVIRPSPPPAGLNDLQPFYLSTVLMAVHKHCYTSLKLTQQGGPDRRETNHFALVFLSLATFGCRMCTPPCSTHPTPNQISRHFPNA